MNGIYYNYFYIKAQKCMIINIFYIFNEIYLGN